MSEEYIHQYSDTVEIMISLGKKDKEISELKQSVRELYVTAKQLSDKMGLTTQNLICMKNPTVKRVMEEEA